MFSVNRVPGSRTQFWQLQLVARPCLHMPTITPVAFSVLRQLACLLCALPLSSSPEQQVTRGTRDSIAQWLLARLRSNWDNLQTEITFGIACPQFVHMVIQLLTDGCLTLSHRLLPIE